MGRRCHSDRSTFLFSPFLPFHFFSFLPSFPPSFSGVGRGGWLQRLNLVFCTCQPIALLLSSKSSPLLHFEEKKKSKCPRMLSLNSIYSPDRPSICVLPASALRVTRISDLHQRSWSPASFFSQQTFLGLDESYSEELSVLSIICFSPFVIQVFGFPLSFLLKYFLNSLNLVWTPEICPALGQDRGLQGPCTFSRMGLAAVSAGFA